MIRRAQDGFLWELQDDFAPMLAALLAGRGEPVKASPAKRVARHSVGGRVFFVKRYLHGAVPLRPFKFFFKSSQARQEWRLAAGLEQREIPVVRHVALGERRSWRGLEESVLITEGFDGVSLEEAPARAINLPAVRAFVDRMHERGVLQRDLHPGNLLLSITTGELRLVDLHGTELKSDVSAAERAGNLALLRGSLAIPVSREIEERSVCLRRERLAYRSKRCQKHNREFVPLRLGGLKWWVRSPFLTDAARCALGDPEGWLGARAEILKPGRTSTVGRADGLVLKRFNFRKLENLVKDLFRPSRAIRAYRKAYHLELVGIPTARPIAAAQRRVCGFLRRSYFLMEEIHGAVGLGDFLRDAARRDRALVTRAAALIGRLHAEGFSHRDLKESNLVVDRAGEIYLLDLDGLVFLGAVPEARAAGDLLRMARDALRHPAISREDRVVFLRRYCRTRGLRRVPRRD